MVPGLILDQVGAMYVKSEASYIGGITLQQAQPDNKPLIDLFLLESCIPASEIGLLTSMDFYREI